jgi:hypothetical protein
MEIHNRPLLSSFLSLSLVSSLSCYFYYTDMPNEDERNSTKRAQLGLPFDPTFEASARFIDLLFRTYILMYIYP